MATTFQNRLVGTIILAAVGIIFLPDLLDGSKITYREETASIPLRPPLDPVSEPVDFDSLDAAVEGAEVDPAVSKEAVVEDTELLVEPPATVALTKTPGQDTVKKPAAKADAVPANAWQIRLGTFKNSDAVDKLVVKLRKAGYQAHRIPRKAQKGQLNRLYVGPNVERKKLEKMLPKLEKLTGLKGVLEKFDATEN